MRILALIFILCPILAFGQLKVSYAPQSVHGWGTTPTTSMLSIQYASVGLMYMNTDAPHLSDRDGNHLAKSNWGIFAIPFTFEKSFFSTSAGAVYFDKKAPTRTGAQFNFRLSAGIHGDFGQMRIGMEYIHISNAWTGIINPGWDLPTMIVVIEL